MKEGTFEGNSIAVYDGENGLTQIYKRSNGYYGYNEDFDFHFESKAELEMMLKKWRYVLIAGSLNENKMKKKLKEGAMSELNLAAKESATYAAFVKRVIEDFPQLAVDINRPAFREFLQTIYDDAKSMNETKLNIRKIIREEITKAFQKEAVNPELDNMVKRFVAGLATKYGYKDRDAVMAIFEGLKRLGLLDKNVNYKAPMMEAISTDPQDMPTIYDLIGQPLEDLGVKIDEMIRAQKDPQWLAALKVIRTSLTRLEQSVDAIDRKLGVMPMSNVQEGVESAFEDQFALDNSKGGTDNSMNKIHRQLLKLQTQMNELVVLWKSGKMDVKTYIAKRKPLQDLRNKLEASLVAI